MLQLRPGAANKIKKTRKTLVNKQSGRLFPEHFHLPRRKPCAKEAVTCHVLSPTLATTCFFSVSVDLPILVGAFYIGRMEWYVTCSDWLHSPTSCTLWSIIRASFLAVTDTSPLYGATTSHLPIMGACRGPRSFQRDDPAAKLILGSERPPEPPASAGVWANPSGSLNSLST